MSETITIHKRTLKRAALVALVLVIALGAYWWRSPESAKDAGEQQSQLQQASMQPQPEKSSQAMTGHAHGAPAGPPKEVSGPVRYSMSEEAKMLAEVQTVAVQRERAVKRLRTVGMVFDAETRVATLTARIAGRLNQVFIDFTGVKVSKSDPMVTIWSPTLITSQVELFESIRSGDVEGVIRGAEHDESG